jgi:cytochrome c oxidase subunit I+III
MVAVVPFDWQAHDTYFVVAHLHYVLIGGMVFPLFAGFYYWMPYVSRHALSEPVGRWVFWLTFGGFNIGFLPMHVTGLLGMPRRVYTYPAGLGWDALNLVSTIGAFMIALGVALFIVDFARRFRPSSEKNAGNVWDAGTLEWLPNGNYSNRSIPVVESAYPLWDQPRLAELVDAGAYYLPGTATGKREALVTAPLDGAPQYVLQMPPLGWAPFLAAIFTAAFFMLLTVKLVALAVICGAIAVGSIWRWAWQLDPGPVRTAVDIGGGVRVPVHCTGPASHSWWAMILLILVAAAIYGSALFSYLYLWLVSPQVWPKPGEYPDLFAGLLTAALIGSSSAAIFLAGKSLDVDRFKPAYLAAAFVLFAAGFAADLWSHRGLSPSASGYGAVVALLLSLEAFYGVAIGAMALYTLAYHRAGRLDRVRRAVFDNTRLFWSYTVAQSLAGLALVHGFPRLANA